MSYLWLVGVMTGPFPTRMMPSKLILPLTAALLLASIACEPSKDQKSSSKPPAQANAPTVKKQQPQQAPSTAPAAQPEQVATAPEAAADQAQALIARVEKEYEAGQANYHAGHLDAARENFDRAFN